MEHTKFLNIQYVRLEMESLNFSSILKNNTILIQECEIFIVSRKKSGYVYEQALLNIIISRQYHTVKLFIQFR